MPRKKPEPSGRKTPLGRLLENSGIKQNDLSRRSGYTQAYISELVNGVKPMNYRVAKRLGEVLGVDYNFLLYGEEPPKHETVETKIIGTIAAGAPILAEENIEGILPLPTQWARVGDFLLRVKGDSMSPRILSGDLVLIRPGVPLENGGIYAVLVESILHEATLKKVYKSDGQVVLVSLNPAYEPMIFTRKQRERITVIGKMMMVFGRGGI